MPDEELDDTDAPIYQLEVGEHPFVFIACPPPPVKDPGSPDAFTIEIEVGGGINIEDYGDIVGICLRVVQDMTGVSAEEYLTKIQEESPYEQYQSGGEASSGEPGHRSPWRSIPDT